MQHRATSCRCLSYLQVLELEPIVDEVPSEPEGHGPWMLVVDAGLFRLAVDKDHTLSFPVLDDDAEIFEGPLVAIIELDRNEEEFFVVALLDLIGEAGSGFLGAELELGIPGHDVFEGVINV